MKPIGETHPHRQAMAANAAWRARALQKPNRASDLDGESRQGTDPRPHTPREETAEIMRQGGTEEAVPFRHVRVTSAFAAQLLGQVLPDPARRLSGVDAYDRDGRPGVALDRFL